MIIIFGRPSQDVDARKDFINLFQYYRSIQRHRLMPSKVHCTVAPVFCLLMRRNPWADHVVPISTYTECPRSSQGPAGPLGHNASITDAASRASSSSTTTRLNVVIALSSPVIANLAERALCNIPPAVALVRRPPLHSRTRCIAAGCRSECNTERCEEHAQGCSRPDRSATAAEETTGDEY